MKRRVLFSLICISLLFLANVDFVYAEPLILNGIKLQKKFEDHSSNHSNVLRFRSRNRYEISYGAEGAGWYDFGIYEIKGQFVYLRPKACRSRKKGARISCKESMGRAKCYTEANQSSLEYSHQLTCKSLKNKEFKIGQEIIAGELDRFPIASFEIKSTASRAGKEIIFQKEPIILMGMIKGKTTDKVNARAIPSLTGKKIIFDEGEHSPYQKLVPKGEKLIIIAKSKKRTKYRKWNMHWYLVNVGFHKRVWLYGQFVKIIQTQ